MEPIVMPWSDTRLPIPNVYSRIEAAAPINFFKKCCFYSKAFNIVPAYKQSARCQGEGRGGG